MAVNSLRTKLILLTLIILIPLTVLQIIRIQTNYKNNIESELAGKFETAELISHSFVNYLEEIWAVEYALGIVVSGNDNFTFEEKKKYMDAVIAHDRVMLRYLWVSPEGKIIASTDKRIKTGSFIKEDYYKRIIAGEKNIISNLFHEETEGKMVLATASAIVREGKLIGTIVGIMDVDKLHDILRLPNENGSSRYTLLDKSGIAVFLNESKNLSYDKRITNAQNPAMEALKGQVEKTYKFKSQYDGTDRMGISYPIKELGWAFIVTSSYDQLVGVHRAAMIRDFTLLVLVTIISLLLAYLLGKQLVKGIEKLRYAAELVSAGNFDVNLEVAACDELKITSQAFNKMSRQISDLIEETNRRNEIKAQFFTTISHELKTPLNIILGSIQLVEKLDGSNAEDYRLKVNKFLGISKQNSFRLLRLINNLIDLNRIEENHISLKLCNSDIISAVESITLSVAEYARIKELELVFDTNAEEKIMAFDTDKIERIMLNLISNAIKFTHKGGIINVNISDKAERLLISVKDTGIGIPVEMHEKVFDKFVQVDNSLQRTTEGSGIGLSLVKSLVELHGGSITINSQYTDGTEFIIDLPVSLVEEEDTTYVKASISNLEKIHIEFSDLY